MSEWRVDIYSMTRGVGEKLEASYNFLIREDAVKFCADNSSRFAEQSTPTSYKYVNGPYKTK